MKIKIDRSKLRKLEPSTNPFLSLARAIIGQQISVAAARSISERFLKLFRGRKPSAKLLLEIPKDKLRKAGLSNQKIIYLTDLAQKFINKTIDPKHFPDMSDEEIKEHLIQVKGIGSWTADMFLIFALNRKNVLPVGDLGIRKGFQKVFLLRNLPTEKRMRILAQEHEGKHTELALHLWLQLEKNNTAN
jgi:DNA-3-methyladenine glycosylase II